MKIRLNIGGKIFETTFSTLSLVPSTFFTIELSKIKKEEELEIFIDRDPKHFRKILNFLRNPNPNDFPLPSNLFILNEMKTEASFYQISTLVEIIENKIKFLSELSENKKKKTQDLFDKIHHVEVNLERILQAIDETYCGFQNGNFIIKLK
ncbi:btb/poz domain-containing adapter for cul3-mediated rhoa degradation protein family member [Anaeramoeba ignava]|uniref:Btb/poz domain-containing adapter for cul3-mediated rhoa degradation protein family member n=1 Tax=Anaeramoeba ignava TaxID=1746090 RepID=A0A9Q0LGF4_ANAIG|nr:btb/poz domain-containing adapter for cul3-mediated rhoa degradation protein family member [Anaeramoeba ignava]